jgi:hypothetical protein
MLNIFSKLMSVFLLMLTTTASAGYIDFTGQNEGVADEFIFTQEGVTLTISAWTANVKSDSDPSLDQFVVTPWQRLLGSYGVYKGSSGLGVISSDTDGSHLDGGEYTNLDDLDEGLLFVFSEQVNFWGFAADYLSSNDDLNLSIVNFLSPTTIETTDIFIDREADSDGYEGFPISSVLGSAFMVWVDGNDDDVRIADTFITKVPEPNMLILFSLVLIGLAVRRKI